MDAQALASFEARAAQAEQRLAALESKLAAGKWPGPEAQWPPPAPAAAPRAAAAPALHPGRAAAAPACCWPPAPLPCLTPPRAGGSGGGGAVDTLRYVAELQSLRTVLLAAKAEQEALEKRVGEVRQPGSCRPANVARCP